MKMPATSTEEEVMAELLSLGSRLKERTVRLLRLMGRRKAAEVPNEQKATRVLGLVFVVLCVFSFLTARKKRKALAASAAAVPKLSTRRRSASPAGAESRIRPSVWT